MSSELDKKMTVIVTGVGAIIGQGIIKSLRLAPQKVFIIGIDRNPSAFGAQWCDSFFQKPIDDSADTTINFLLDLFESHFVDLVLPGIEQDVYFFDQYRQHFSSLNTKIVLNNKELIRLGQDKWRAFTRLSELGMKLIPTANSGDWNNCIKMFGQPPFLLKPRRGSGGQGNVLLHDEADYNYWLNKLGDNFMVQKLVGTDDDEYTVSVFGFGDGTSVGLTIMRRRLGPGGATWQAETVASCPLIEEFTESLSRELKPLGPTNYQYRLEGEDVYFLEVNPRISASTSIRAALGVNEAWMCIQHFCLGFSIEPVKLAMGKAHRYVEDAVEKL